MTYGVLSIPSAAAAPSLPLDVESADGAFSMRLISSTYEGDCLLVRRSSDNAELAFGFGENGWLDTAAITTWLGGANPFVKTWYDQSGNGNDVTQANTSLQPPLLLSDADGNPALDPTGTQYLVGSAFPVSTQGTITTVARKDTEEGLDAVWASADTASTGRYLLLYPTVNTTRPSIQIAQRDNDTAGAIEGTFINEVGKNSLYIVESDGEQYYFERDGIVEALNAFAGTDTGDWFGDTSARDNFVIGALVRTGAAAQFKGKISEVIIYPVKLESADKAAIRSNIGAAYSIAVDALVDSAWIWFGGPWAVSHEGSTYIITTNSTFDVVIFEVDNTSSALVNSFTLKSAYDTDDHVSECVLILPDDKLLVAYTGHNSTSIFVRKSTNAADITAWGAEADIDSQLGHTAYTYPTLIQLTGETGSPIYLIYRDSPGSQAFPCFSTSTDDGVTWAAGQALVTNGLERVYFKACQNGTDRIDFVVSTGHPFQVATSLYHFYYQGDNFYQTDGTLIGDETDLPLSLAQLTLVYDGTTTSGWQWDIAVDGSGNPVFVFATFPTAASDHRYRYARWNGSAWNHYEISVAGGPIGADTHYSGGVTLDPTDVNTVYLSRPESGKWQIFKCVTADGGETWTPTQLTSTAQIGDRAYHLRPFVPLNADANLGVIWMYGRYTTAADYKTILLSNPQYTT